MDKIFINFDYHTGNELSYEEGLHSNVSFETNVLDFFSFDTKNCYDVIVRRKDGLYISRNELLQNKNEYCDKHIRHEHNIHKMLVAGAFTFKSNSVGE